MLTVRLDCLSDVDVAWNYVFLGDIATAAGLSAVNLVAGPVFYVLHEAAWNLYGSPGRPASLSSSGSITTLPPEQPGDTAPAVQVLGFTLSCLTSNGRRYRGAEPRRQR